MEGRKEGERGREGGKKIERLKFREESRDLKSCLVNFFKYLPEMNKDFPQTPLSFVVCNYVQLSRVFCNGLVGLITFDPFACP